MLPGRARRGKAQRAARKAVSSLPEKNEHGRSLYARVSTSLCPTGQQACA